MLVYFVLAKNCYAIAIQITLLYYFICIIPPHQKRGGEPERKEARDIPLQFTADIFSGRYLLTQINMTSTSKKKTSLL